MRRDSGGFMLMTAGMRITRLVLFSAALAVVSPGAIFAQETVAPASVKAKAPDLRAVFSPYLGTWKGEAKVMNAEQQPLSVLGVEQRYHWETAGAVLAGEAVYTAKDREGKTVTVTVHSRTTVRDGEIFAELTQGKETERFTALVDEDGFLVFIPEGTPKGKTPEKLTTTRVETEQAQTVIRVRGFERITIPDKEGKPRQAVLLLEGKLVKQPEKDR